MIWITIENIHKFLLSILNEIDEMFPYYIVKIPMMYGFLLLCWTVLLAIYDGLIVKSISTGIELLYKTLRANRSVSVIRVLSEWYYLIDKLLHFISPHVISYSSPSVNVLDKANILSPIFIYRMMKSFFLNMFVISFGSLLSWGVILSYVNPTLVQEVGHFLGELDWSDVNKELSRLSFKSISDFINLFSLFLSVFVIFILSSSSFKWKAMKKVNEEKYEQAIKHQERIEDILMNVLYYSKKNIDRFNHKIKYLPNIYGELITRTSNYRLEKGQFKKDQATNYYSDTNIEDLTRGYESLQELITRVNQILKEIDESRLYNVFNKINKSVRYETIRLSLIYRTRLDWELIDGERMKETLEARRRSVSHLIKDFDQLRSVWGGWLKREALEEEYNKHGGSSTFEEIVENREKELAEEILEFNKFLHETLEDAIFHHIVLEQYLEISRKNTRFNFLRVLLSFFGTK